ncbi:sec-independent protein translocase protein TatB [Rhodopseudomonas rhenobacensis]|uniref:Sec-independent protein translocase protein TatB n=1 Tax=Rhodopseudomonas rhenobacensis TaxID=87461 RepID=A0A7W7Z4P0_9BRAD|nr:Sec-independent protein translocase protein TatB [Rhodopseudomonas rhenobacensis]MBB5047889.1 sec-independent protein translocase protein TatB [Rhodopseudomonas rhenobacensis]
MFDIGWSELLVIGVVALIAIGPKELPGVLRMVGQWMGKARKMAAEFQGQFNEAMREAEMADLKKSFDDIKATATTFSRDNIMTSLQKDIDAAMTIDKIEHVDTPPMEPTTPEPPTAETLLEAETHAATTGEAPIVVPTPDAQAGEPLAITQEIHPAITQEVHPALAPPAPDVVAEPIKDAKAS